MGKNDKKDAKLKAEKKKLKQANKQEKSIIKRTKKELQASGEEDIESILAAYRAGTLQRETVTITNLGPTPPSRRCNFSINHIISNNEFLIYGGEYHNGAVTEVYSDVYRWNLEKSPHEYRLIESLNTPSPRCSHQSVYYKDKIYMFGGEYATLDQFYHYKDFWELDVKTNIWVELKPTGDIPAARSGHRMLVWRNYIILFGGFYEAMREVKWFNDLYLYSIQDQRWTLIPYKKGLGNSVPKPRSGFQMFLHQQEDCLYIYGGFSKDKVSVLSDGNATSKNELKIHEDMWMLNLKPILGSSSTSSSSKGLLDVSKAVWQKISRKGDYPSPRSGAVVAMYKNKALLFGGVYDEEGARHTLVSTFFNDLHAFDLERKRWFKLGLKQKKIITEKKSKKIRNNHEKLMIDSNDANDIIGVNVQQNDDEEDLDDDEEEEDENDDGTYNNENNKKELFGYIDENGNVIYINLDEMDEAEIKLDDIKVDVNLLNLKLSENEQKNRIKMNSNDFNGHNEDEKLLHSKSNNDDLKANEENNTNSSVNKYFIVNNEPCPRFNPALIVKGNTLYVFGGITEIGNIEITLDDCWSLDLNKRDVWKKDNSDTHSNDEVLTNKKSITKKDQIVEQAKDNIKLSNKKQSQISSPIPVISGVSRRGMKGGLRAEMEELRSQFNITDNDRTPRNGETLRQFYSRTADYWSSEVIKQWNEQNANGNQVVSKSEVLSEKEIKRQAFILSEVRYNELLPMLSRLNQLEDDQQVEEDSSSGIINKNKNRKGSGGMGRKG
eukprot:gene9482-12773_t